MAQPPANRKVRWRPLFVGKVIAICFQCEKNTPTHAVKKRPETSSGPGRKFIFGWMEIRYFASFSYGQLSIPFSRMSKRFRSTPFDA
jgi:hypothetical protein